jgi:formate-dependent nitrite reductase membrane component NrfD
MNAGVWGMTSLSGAAFLSTVTAFAEAGAVPQTALAIIGTPLALFVGTYTGVLLGHSSIPLWAKSSLLPALFGCSSLATGAAAVSFFGELFGIGSRAARKRVAAAERVASLAEGIALAAWLRETGEFAKPLREAPLKDIFEKGVVGAGIAMPLALPGSAKRSGPWDILKPLLVLAGGLALRYVLVEGGRRQSRDAAAYLKYTSTPPQT